MYTVGHKGGIIIFTTIYGMILTIIVIIDLNNSIHSQILLNNNLRVFLFREC